MMVVKMAAPGRSFGGVADYCLHDPRMQKDDSKDDMLVFGPRPYCRARCRPYTTARPHDRSSHHWYPY